MGEVSGSAEWSTKVFLHPTVVRNADVKRRQTGLLLFFLFSVFSFFPCVNGQPVRGELGNRIAGPADSRCVLASLLPRGLREDGILRPSLCYLT